VNELNEFLRTVLFLPRQGSSMARSVDILHYTVILMTMLGATAVFAVALFFVLRYRAGNRPLGPTPRIVAPLWLEGLFISATLGLFLIWWQIGFRQYVQLEVPPEGALDVYVSAKQWMWRFAYPGGQTSISVLYVPTGRPVRLVMTSRDVIHSFYVPEFRVKQDVVPGRTTATWFEVREPGNYQILCAEYCGAGHSTMRGEVIALDPVDWDRWLGGATATLSTPPGMTADEPFVVTGESEPRRQTSMVDAGAHAAARYGCLRCHSLDGQVHIGPSWVGLYGARRQFEDGASAIADEAYLTESMMDPAKHVVAGFRPVMPSFQGILPAGDVAAIVELIRSLAHTPAGVPLPPPPQPIPGVPRP
jgi:cytochrome c oxidase subunit II